jgi:hypothetical protein
MHWALTREQRDEKIRATPLWAVVDATHALYLRPTNESARRFDPLCVDADKWRVAQRRPSEVPHGAQPKQGGIQEEHGACKREKTYEVSLRKLLSG